MYLPWPFALQHKCQAGLLTIASLSLPRCSSPLPAGHCTESQAGDDNRTENKGTLTKRQQKGLMIVHKAHATKSRGYITWTSLLWFHNRFSERRLVSQWRTQIETILSEMTGI